MGRILVPIGGGFQSMVLSLFFRVPQASMDAARANYNPDLDASLLSGILPLMTFGPDGIEALQYDIGFGEGPLVGSSTGTFFDTGHFDSEGNVDCGWRPVSSGTNPGANADAFNGVKSFDPKFNLEPSWIGIDCREDKNVFNFNFAYTDRGTAEYVGVGQRLVTNVSNSSNDFYQAGGGDFDVCPLPYVTYPGVVDGEGNPLKFLGAVATATKYIQGEMTTDLNGGKAPNPERWAADPDTAAAPSIEPDKWHHLLLSPSIGSVSALGVDYGADASAQGDCSTSARLYAALDDDNISGKALTTYLAKNTNNNWLTEGGYATSKFGQVDPGGSDSSLAGGGIQLTVTTSGTPFPSYSFSSPDVRLDTVYIPGDDTNLLMQMAALQIFLGETGNTAGAGLRRAFLTDKGKPARPGVAEKFFGRKPDVMFFKRSSWIEGTNEGTMDIKPSVVGTIQKFNPDPTIGNK
jgi:hypothetical protein